RTPHRRGAVMRGEPMSRLQHALSVSVARGPAARRTGSGAAALALGLALGLAAGPAAAGSADTKETATDGAVGAAAGLSTVLYGPAKVAYAAGGSIVAGLAYVLSGGDADVAKPILDASVRGDYVVTPEHVRGERSLEFVGRSAEDEALRA